MKATTFFQRVFNKLPPVLAKVIKGIYLLLMSPRGFSSWRLWVLSDEVNKYQHIIEAINYIRVAGDQNRLPSTYFEFGCHSGRTFSAAINAVQFLKMDDFEFHAFDSFQGLPETDEADGYFEEGTFDTSQADFVSIVKRRTGKLLAGDSIHSGFYVDSLTTELQARLPKIGVLYVDVDLYSSTVELLEFVEPLLCDGTVILFDDWYCFPLGTSGGEGLAVEHFLSKRQGIEMVPWKAYSTFGQSFFVKKSVSCSDSDG